MKITVTKDAGGVTTVAAEEPVKVLQVLSSPKPAGKPS